MALFVDEWVIVCLEQNTYDGQPLYWGPNRCGYTGNIDEAGVYTLSEALAATTRDMPLLKAYALRLSRRLAELVSKWDRAEAEFRNPRNYDEL